MALDFAAGCVGGCAGVLVGHPLDTVKVRLQTQNDARYRGTIHCIQSIVKREGFKGLYKGMSSPLAGLAAINAIGFGVYGNVVQLFDDKSAPSSQFIAGAMSGLVQTIICCPMELTKLRVQIQRSNGNGKLKYKNPYDCLIKTYKVQGIAGLYRGMGLTILRDCPAFGVYFASYEMLVRKFSSDGKADQMSVFALLLAGGLAGMFSWLANYPTDVLKTRFQADGCDPSNLQYRSIVECIRKTYKEGGLHSFTKGLGSTLLRAFPTNAATFFAAEWTFRLHEMYFGVQEEILSGRITPEDAEHEQSLYGVHRKLQRPATTTSYTNEYINTLIKAGHPHALLQFDSSPMYY